MFRGDSSQIEVSSSIKQDVLDLEGIWRDEFPQTTVVPEEDAPQRTKELGRPLISAPSTSSVSPSSKRRKVPWCATRFLRLELRQLRITGGFNILTSITLGRFCCDGPLDKDALKKALANRKEARQFGDPMPSKRHRLRMKVYRAVAQQIDLPNTWKVATSDPPQPQERYEEIVLSRGRRKEARQFGDPMPSKRHRLLMKVYRAVAQQIDLPNTWKVATSDPLQPQERYEEIVLSRGRRSPLEDIGVISMKDFGKVSEVPTSISQTSTDASSSQPA
ncbi:unnamed protein product [Ilex paraguariensis]|uniref:Uncharacterized protein n=1 Tax=Ilex paraguariensis TaxID=185542 RepID=A0ABC8RPT4_9AQUA